MRVKRALQKFQTFTSRLLADDRGQSTTEYILILSVVVLVAMKFKNEFGKKLDALLNKVSGQMDDALQ